jgi:hypothetical protein
MFKSFHDKILGEKHTVKKKRTKPRISNAFDTIQQKYSDFEHALSSGWSGLG